MIDAFPAYFAQGALFRCASPETETMLAGVETNQVPIASLAESEISESAQKKVAREPQ